MDIAYFTPDNIWHNGRWLIAGLDRVAVGVVTVVELVHGVAEEGADLVLAFVLGFQLRDLFGRAGEEGADSRHHLRKTRFHGRLLCTRFLGGGIAEFAGIGHTGLLVGAKVHIRMHAYFLTHALYESHRMDSCHSCSAIRVRHRGREGRYRSA